jgi:hypothetical protein
LVDAIVDPRDPVVLRGTSCALLSIFLLAELFALWVILIPERLQSRHLQRGSIRKVVLLEIKL